VRDYPTDGHTRTLSIKKASKEVIHDWRTLNSEVKLATGLDPSYRASEMDIPADRPTKAFSCVRCFERKVKCDKQHPCSGCVRSKAECVFRVPAAPRRKKKRPQEEILLAKLKQYEELLQSKGINVDEIQSSSTVTSGAGSSSQPTVPSFSAETELPGSHTDYYTHPKGKLIMDQGRSLFIENNLWTSVSEEVSSWKFTRPGIQLDTVHPWP